MKKAKKTRAAMSYYGKIVKFCRAGMWIACVGLVLVHDQNALAITNCSAATSITNFQNLESGEIDAECGSVPAPCNPGACSYSLSSSGMGTFTNCGKLTKCMWSGEDPPISNPNWNEPLEGFQGQGANLMSGKCYPPLAPNYFVYCPNVGRTAGAAGR